jgi:hypothetical protein
MSGPLEAALVEAFGYEFGDDFDLLRPSGRRLGKCLP